MLRAALVSALVAAASADTFGTFTPSLSVYVNQNGTCFGNTPTLVIDGSKPDFSTCTAVQGTNLYVSLPACNVDDNANGPAPCFSTNKDCSACIDTDNFGFGYCSVPNQFSNTISYVSTCAIEPCCTSSGWVISLAVILSVSTLGLCVLWRIRDIRALARAKADAIAHAASVEAENAKNNSVTSISISAGGGAGGAHGGYSAL